MAANSSTNCANKRSIVMHVIDIALPLYIRCIICFSCDDVYLLAWIASARTAVPRNDGGADVSCE